MPLTPESLPAGTCLGARYTVQETLGHGGFAITYVAWDDRTADRCVLKELAPQGTSRRADGTLDWGYLGEVSARRLQHQFRREIETLRRLRSPGVVPIRDAFQAGGTVWLAMDFFPASQTLAQRLVDRGLASATEAESWFRQILDTLEIVHRRGILHRDLKPSNILIDERDQAWLIDFGAAREWHPMGDPTHTVLFTPGYAPPEQLTPEGRRGPATDLYGLAATLWNVLTGVPPPDAMARVAGSRLPNLATLRPDLSPEFIAALTQALELPYDARPANATVARDQLASAPAGPASLVDLPELIAQMEALRTFRFGRRECPACGDVLEDAHPLPAQICPVCREAKIQRRRLVTNQCPLCPDGVLLRRSNGEPLRRCPTCRTGRLRAEGLPVPFRPRRYACGTCGATYSADGAVVTQTMDGRVGTWAEFRDRSGRTEVEWECETCGGQFDETSRGRRVQIAPAGGDPEGYYADEWDRLAAGLDPGAGNSECPTCGADFDVDAAGACLLEASTDPYDVVENIQGRPLSWETLRWLGAGKTSGEPGPTCMRCGTEFDGKDGPMELIRTGNARLRLAIGESESLADWHRRARGLPNVGDEAELYDQIDDVLRAAYGVGELPFDAHRPDLEWRGSAVRYLPEAAGLSEKGRATLTVTSTEWRFGGPIRAKRVDESHVDRIFTQDGRLYVEAGRESWILRLTPVDLKVDLPGRTVILRLDERDLVRAWAARRARLAANATMPERDRG